MPTTRRSPDRTTYAYYLTYVDVDGVKIVAGWENEEDAVDAEFLLRLYGRRERLSIRRPRVYSRADLVRMGVSPKKASSWRSPLGTTSASMREALVAAGLQMQGYMNCRLFVQELLRIPRLEALPIASSLQFGDVLQFGTLVPRHWAVYLGDGEVLQVAGWGDRPEVALLDDVLEEYDPPIIRRPPPSTYAWLSSDP